METAQELEILGSLVLIVAAVATLLVAALLHPGSALAPVALAVLGLGFVGLRHALRTHA